MCCLNEKIPVGTWTVVIIVIMVSLIDLRLTIWAAGIDPNIESNPIARKIIDYGTFSLIFFKVILVVIGCGSLCVARYLAECSGSKKSILFVKIGLVLASAIHIALVLIWLEFMRRWHLSFLGN